MPVELGPHQLKAISELENGNILGGAVGVGKSRTAIAYYFLQACKGQLRLNGFGEREVMKNPMDLYVITTAKKRNSLDWEEEAVAFGIPRDRVNSMDGVQIKVDSWNNIEKYIGVKNAFFIFDEQRLIGSGLWVKSFIKIAKSNQWILLSATPGDNWMDYIPVMVANGFYRNRSEFIEKHVIFNRFAKFAKVERYVAQGRLHRNRQQILVDMPFTKHTTRHLTTIPVSFDKKGFEQLIKTRWDPFKNKPIRDVGALCYVMRRFVNSDPSRLEAITKLSEEHPRMIIFYNFIYELESLRTLGESLEIEVAEWNGSRHEDLPTGERWLYLVQYTAGAEGWNCITTDTIVFHSLNYSYRITEQAKGRTDRINTPFSDLHYFTLASNSQIDLSIGKAVKGKKNFNEKAFAKVFPQD